MIEQILSYRGKKTVILATGDPTWYGIGATLTRYVPLEEFAIHPAPSAFSLAAARLKWPLQNTACVSVHGRPVELLNAHIVPGNRILALTSDATSIERSPNYWYSANLAKASHGVERHGRRYGKQSGVCRQRL